MQTKNIIQVFDCYILSIEEDNTFWARLIDMTHPEVQEGIEEDALFEFNIFKQEEQQYIQEGLLFKINIYEIIDDVTLESKAFNEFIISKRNRKEQAVFNKELRKIKKRAAMLSKKIRWESAVV